MNKRLISLMAAALALLSASGQVTFTLLGNKRVIEETPSLSETGLHKIFVVYDTDSVEMSFTSSTGQKATWFTFDANSWGSPREITNISWDGTKTTLREVIPDMGYIIYDGTTPHFYWVVDYAKHYLELNDMFMNVVSPNGPIVFTVDGQGEAIPYCSIHGVPQTLDRNLKFTYSTLEWNDTIAEWKPKTVVNEYSSLNEQIKISTPPLCKTQFTLSGDRFLRQWNLTDSVTIWPDFDESTMAVGCATLAELLDNDANEVSKQGDVISGSAPIRVLFTGFPTPNVAYRLWEMAKDEAFEETILQFNQDVVDYTFNDTGTYYMRYMVANESGSCQVYGDTIYTIMVRESYIPERLPNIFSPGSTKDVNDVWTVPHKSLVEFHCWIYNRWGTLLYEFTDPNGGWDGTYHGRLVDTGVYYYVVTATGSDGVKYKRRGDINILLYKGNSGSSTDSGAGG